METPTNGSDHQPGEGEVKQITELLGRRKNVGGAQSEWAELVGYFHMKINRHRKSNIKDYSPAYVARILSPFVVKNTPKAKKGDYSLLYTLKSKCEDEERRTGNWGREFWRHIIK